GHRARPRRTTRRRVPPGPCSRASRGSPIHASTATAGRYHEAMSAETVGRHMPAIMTLDDLTAMMAADEHHHRYEISPEGVLSVMPPPGYAHAIIATRLTVWLAAAGIPADRIAPAVGLRLPGREGGEAGRIPDPIFWTQ